MSGKKKEPKYSDVVKLHPRTVQKLTPGLRSFLRTASYSQGRKALREFRQAKTGSTKSSVPISPPKTKPRPRRMTVGEATTTFGKSREVFQQISPRKKKK